MSHPKKDELALAAIDPAALAQVTGGTSESKALLNQVTGLLDSIKSIRSVSSQQGIAPQEMMLFMMLLQQRNQAQQVIVAAPAPWWTRRY